MTTPSFSQRVLDYSRRTLGPEEQAKLKTTIGTEIFIALYGQSLDPLEYLTRAANICRTIIEISNTDDLVIFFVVISEIIFENIKKVLTETKITKTVVKVVQTSLGQELKEVENQKYSILNQKMIYIINSFMYTFDYIGKKDLTMGLLDIVLRYGSIVTLKDIKKTWGKENPAQVDIFIKQKRGHLAEELYGALYISGRLDDCF